MKHLSSSLAIIAIAPIGSMLSSCKIGTPPPPANPIGITSSQIGPCSGPAIRVIQVIRVSVPDDLALGVRHVGIPLSGATDTDDEALVKAAPVSNIPEFNTNPFHIDLTAFNPLLPNKRNSVLPPLKGKDYYEVRVVLTGSNFKFDTTDKDANGNIINGVAYGSVSATPASFCGANTVHLAGELKPNGTAYKHAVAIFYIPYKAPSSAAPVSVGYNILIESLSAVATPVIIDPKVENNG